MTLTDRINLMTKLGTYITSGDPAWEETKQKAFYANGWFIPEFIQQAADNIARNFLQKNILEEWSRMYTTDTEPVPQTVGLIMAGNIPMAGFHDLLAVFISGHTARVKLSSKDAVLIKHLAGKLAEWDPATTTAIQFADLLKNSDAYIATGSNNSSRYFDYYFQKYPHIIRRNRTSVALLTGNESKEELSLLADDIFLYFGLGCRNVTKVYVPENYVFDSLMEAMKKYDFLADHHKFKNNFDYNLSILLLNNTQYLSNGLILLVQDSSLFSPISQLHYEYYSNQQEKINQIQNEPALQCIVGHNHVPFGQAQCPGILDYADGADTMQFLSGLSAAQHSL